LTCQLQNSEAGDDDVIAVPVVEYRIKDGKVEMFNPTELIIESKFDDEVMIRKFSDPYSERGCTIEMFREAVDYVRNKYKKELEDVKN
jgi:hypothetical protein